MNTVTKPRAVFGVAKREIPALLIRAMSMHDGIVANAATFGSPTVTMVAFLALITALSSGQQAAKENKGKVTSTARNTKRDALWTAMQSLQMYVQGLADVLSAESASALIVSAGLRVAGVGSHAKPVLAAILTATPGGVHLVAHRNLLLGTANGSKKLMFNWEMSANGGQTWTALTSTAYASTDVTGLTLLSTYSFRVSVTVSKVAQPWSQAVSVLVH
jgi:hypothetical protein